MKEKQTQKCMRIFAKKGEKKHYLSQDENEHIRAKVGRETETQKKHKDSYQINDKKS